MARYASIQTALWSDANFTSLEVDAQWLYLMLSTQPEVDTAGRLPLRPRRWSNYTADQTVETIRRALDALAAAGFVAVDEDGQEVTIRSVARSQCEPVRRRKRPKMPARLRLQIYERDNYTCQHCMWSPGRPEGYRGHRPISIVVGTRRKLVRTGWDTDEYVTVDVVRMLVIDHIHPLAAGGAFKDPANLQSLCSPCNGRKWAHV